MRLLAVVVGHAGRRLRDRHEVAHHGAALLVVIGTTSALAVVVSLLLVASLAAYEANSYRADRDQAYLLGEAVLDQTERALHEATVPLPRRARAVQILNGRLVPGGATVPVGVFPAPDSAWPPTSERPAPGGAMTLGVGASVRLEVVLGPRGDLRGASLVAGSGRLIDASVAVWFRRAHVTIHARFVVLPDGGVERLD